MFKHFDIDNEHYEKYTNTLQLDHECNYLDPEKTSSNNFIVSCINKPKVENPLNYDKCLNTGVDIIEGFSSDISSKGSGVSYTPKGMCHDGYSKNENGVCNIQNYRGRTRDGRWQRGHHTEIMHDGKENYQLCGNNQFLGLSNGFPLCEEKEETLKIQDIIPFEKETTETFSNF